MPSHPGPEPERLQRQQHEEQEHRPLRMLFDQRQHGSQRDAHLPMNARPSSGRPACDPTRRVDREVALSCGPAAAAAAFFAFCSSAFAFASSYDPVLGSCRRPSRTPRSSRRPR